jgi:formate dehydrogenase alpha subunit
MDSSNPFFILDPNKCILCGKCVWTCSEIVGADTINFTLRGFDAYPMFDERCESCGDCVAICPVGALVEKDFRWPKQEVKTICPYCAVGCGIYLGLDNGAIVSVRGDEENPVNRGSLCAKGRFGIAEFVHHPDRLTTPLLKKGRRFMEISWEEAIDLIAKKLTQYKGEEFGLTASVKSTNEDNYILQKFARVVMGSNNIDNASRLRDAPSLVGLGESLGSSTMSNPMDDIEAAACIFAIGTNATFSHPILGQRIRRAARKGAKIIVVNPREIDLCRNATLWLRNRPGSDLALLMGMMRVIVDEGLADQAFIKERCENFDALKKSLSQFDLELAEELSGVPQPLIAEAARTYAQCKPATILYGSGLTQHIHGTQNVLALADLAMLCGNMGKAGGGLNSLKGQNNAQGACDMGALPNFLPGYQPLSDPGNRQKFEAAWGCRLEPSPGLSLGEMLEAAQEGKIKALYIVGADPMLDMANTQQVHQALKRLEFLVVQDIFLSQTARLAELVLPAASFAEKDGTFTNNERRAQLVRRAIDPMSDSRPDWQIACQIAQKMGARGFDFEQPAQIMDEIARLVPAYGGISHQRLEHEAELLHTETSIRGKGRFMPLVYHPPAEVPDEEYPLILTIERSIYHMGNMSRKVKGLNTLRPEELVEINPLDAADLGVGENEWVRVISRRGEVKVKAKITEASPPGVVCMSSQFSESPTNLLTNSTLDAASKTPELKSSAVRIEKI